MKPTVPFVVGALLAMGAPDLAGQTAGAPVTFSPSRPDALLLGADVGFGHGAYAGLRQTWGRRAVGLAAAEGVLPADGAWTVGAAVSLHPIKGFQRPVALSVDGGAGYAMRDDDAGRALRRWDVFAGVGVAWESLTALGDVEPWIAARWHMRRSTFEQPAGTETRTDHGAGVSAGVRITVFQPAVIRGWGLHAAVDRLFDVASPFPLRIGDPGDLVFAVGVHRRF